MVAAGTARSRVSSHSEYEHERIFAAIFAFVASAQLSLACTTIIVGKKATVDGSILVARNDDGPGITAVNFLYHPPKARRLHTAQRHEEPVFI